ncbi:MAG: DUF3300 domain-containing protein [Bryobacteraceae bacterium]
MSYTSWPRQMMAVALSFLLLPFVQSSFFAQQPPPGGYAPLDAMQLDQLVAPIALYPDSLVAQVLTASTFAGQVGDADNWIHQNGGMPPDQLAAAVDTMPWDPSVKALAEFPTVLDNMARNSGWTAALGNAYYNQPGDVMNAVQAMRFQAQQAGTLQSTPQERVYSSGGLVVIEPVNPALVYVPYYNPWTVYGAPIAAWGGYYWGPPSGVVLRAGIAVGFGVGIGIGLFAHYGWGYHAWSPNWHGGVVVYNHTTYISRSTTVINRGHFGGYNRGVFEHTGRGVPGGYRPAVTAQTAVYAHPGPAGAYRPAAAPSAHPAPAAAYHPASAPAYHPIASPSHLAAAPAYRPPANTARPAAAAPASHPQAKPAPKAPPNGGSKPAGHSAPKSEHHEK